MKTFIKLVDKGSPSKLFRRYLGMNPKGVRSHFKFVNYYRLYIELFDKISELQKEIKQVKPEQRNNIREQIKELRISYKPRLIEAKG